ncbi:MAG: hypothetical protein ACM3XO_09525 [Bacteroidota bacterium]
MTDNVEITDSTQPNKPVARTRRGRTILFSALGLIAILAIAVLAGYSSGIGVRERNQSSAIMQQLGEQYQNALIDIQFGRYEIAKQRLEWIISKNSTFPGAQQKLTEVLVLSNQPTPTITPSLTPTPDFTGAQDAFSKAQQLIAAKDWPGAIGALDQMRKYDPNYQASLVDGMYYFALRNYGYDLIIKQGNLEGGIYQLTLAERFGPLDRDTNGLREGARYYLIGASFWELNWKEAVNYFDQVYRGWSGLWDGTMTSSQRFWFASMRYGDELYKDGQNCDAVAQYDNAQAIAALDEAAARNYNDAYSGCHPATPTAEVPTAEAPTEVVPAPTEPPAATQPPIPATTEPPASPTP